jgi:oligosaccharide repeat unit polymerase
MLILSSLGGRKSTIELVFISLLVWHYGVKRIRKIPFFKTIAIIALLCLYFIAIPLIRAPGGFEYYTNNMGQLWEDIYSNGETLIKQTSYVDHYLLVINYFDSETYWWGKSFIDLLTAPIPSSIYPNKPPVDEGVYLRTIAEGYNPVPPTAYSDLYQSSWPPETFGVMYMNFGFLGVILGMYILGAIYRFIYEYMNRSSFSLYSIIIYGIVLFSFHLSNLRIVQFGIEFLWLTLFFMIVFGLKIKRIKSI